VVFGSNSGFGAGLNLSDLNGSNGFAINGIAALTIRLSVSSAGDVNGDGFDDLIIGARVPTPTASVCRAKLCGVWQQQWLWCGPQPVTLNGSNGFAINGIAAVDESGSSVSSAGDVNGDGFDDLIIGANGADPNGISMQGKVMCCLVRERLPPINPPWLTPTALPRLKILPSPWRLQLC
jgi:hypothetical protein